MTRQQDRRIARMITGLLLTASPGVLRLNGAVHGHSSFGASLAAYRYWPSLLQLSP